MSSAATNKHIARLIVGAMSIDGELDKAEREKVAASLTKMGMPELIADMGLAIEEDCGDFNLFAEAKTIMDDLGSQAEQLTPAIFRIVCSVVASDRFVSSREASYLCSLGARLQLQTDKSQAIFRSILSENRARLEVAGSGIDEVLNTKLKEFLSFEGAEDLIGAVDEDSLEEMIHNNADSTKVSHQELKEAMAVLGLKANAKLDDATKVWREAIDNLNLPKMADIGETFVTSALSRLNAVHSAYKKIVAFHEQINMGQKAA